jgi:hypothetical protein
MKAAVLAVVAIVVYAIACWLIFTPGIPQFPFFVPVIVAVFVVPPLGGWWLIYIVIRHEKHMFPIVLLAFVPYGFVWYYFERVRNGTHKSRQLV